MKRSLALALIACLACAPCALAQKSSPAPPKTSPTGAPQSNTPSGQSGADTPTAAAPTSAGNAQIGGKSSGQDQPGAGKDGKAKDPKAAAGTGMDEQMKAWQEAGKPGPNHKWLEQFEGEWQAEVKDLSTGTESTDKGTMISKMVYGKRFLGMDYDGRFHGQFFRGGGMVGYNNTTKRYESSWADSMGSAISFMSGTVSADGKTLTLTGDMTDPTAKGGKSAAKEVWTVLSKDSYKQEFYMGDKKSMEITYTKGKAAADAGGKKDEKPKTK